MRVFTAVIACGVVCALAPFVFVAQAQRAFAPITASNQRAMFACLKETGNDRSRMRDCFYRRDGIGRFGVVTNVDARL